jgi:hypothetical protein
MSKEIHMPSVKETIHNLSSELSALEKQDTSYCFDYQQENGLVHVIAWKAKELIFDENESSRLANMYLIFYMPPQLRHIGTLNSREIHASDISISLYQYQRMNDDGCWEQESFYLTAKLKLVGMNGQYITIHSYSDTDEYSVYFSSYKEHIDTTYRRIARRDDHTPGPEEIFQTAIQYIEEILPGLLSRSLLIIERQSTSVSK